jgi:hypothetical protein
MFLILVLLKIKVDRTGFQETKISLNFREVVHNLYTAQMNTWTILLRLITYYIEFNHTFAIDIYSHFNVSHYIVILFRHITFHGCKMVKYV